MSFFGSCIEGGYMVVVVKNGKAELCKNTGSRVACIGTSGAVSAALSADESLVAVCYSSGKVGVYKATGTLSHMFPTKDAVGVSFSGNDVLIARSGGKSELHRPTGALIRTF